MRPIDADALISKMHVMSDWHKQCERYFIAELIAEIDGEKELSWKDLIPKGEWVHETLAEVAICDQCYGEIALGGASTEEFKGVYRFCPNCGSRMCEEEE